MKSKSLSVLVLVIPFFVQFSFADNVLKKADSLVALHKYNSAFSLLNEVVETNDDRQIVLKKIDIALNYFVLSLNHVIFSFKDLEPGDDLMELRGKEGIYNSYLFRIDSVLARLISRFPQDGVLYRYLGDYFYDISMRYAGRWLFSDDSLASLVLLNYAEANRLHCENYESLHRLGVAYLQRADFASAQPCFIEAIRLDPKQADPYYNLAYLYMQRNDYDKAIELGKKAFELYEDTGLRSDAGRLIASCYTSRQDYQNALVYLERVDRFDPSNYYTYRMVLWAYLKLGEADSAYVAARRLFGLHPTFPSNSQAVIEDYTNAGEAGKLVSVFRRILPDYCTNDTVAGNIYFHLATRFLNDSDSSQALVSLDSSEVRFRRCYPGNHQVFEVIQSERELIKKK